MDYKVLLPIAMNLLRQMYLTEFKILKLLMYQINNGSDYKKKLIMIELKIKLLLLIISLRLLRIIKLI